MSRRRAVLLSIALLPVLAASTASWRYREASRPPEPMDAAAELVALRDSMQPVPGGDDAWPRYVAIFRDTLGMSAFNDRNATPLAAAYWRVRSEDFGALLAGDWNDPRHEEGKRILESLEPMLAALRHATSAPNCRAPIFADSNIAFELGGKPVDFSDAPPGDPASHYSEPLRLLAPMFLRLLAVDARVAAHTADFNRAADDYRQLLAIAGHMGASPLHDTQTARFHLARLTGESIRRSLLESEWPEPAIDALLAALPTPDWFNLSEYTERTAAVHAHMNARRHARLLEDARADARNLPRLLTAPTPRRVAEACEEYYRRSATVIDGPPFARRPKFEGDYDAAQIAIETTKSITLRRDRAKAGLAATRIILLLEKHHALTGEWPDALDEIMPLEDTLEPNTREPFVYTRTPEGPLPFTLRAPDAAAAFIHNEEHRDFTKPREKTAK